MMDKNLTYLLEQYNDRMAMLTEAIARGNCKDFEEYRFVCGQLRGLEAACAVIQDLTERLENSDD
jgi:hypothetical protein